MCSVLDWVTRNTLRWFGYMETEKSDEFVKKVHVSETEGPRRGRPVARIRFMSTCMKKLLIEGEGFN